MVSMKALVSVIAVILQLKLSSCHHMNSGNLKDSWLSSYPFREHETRFERQMPPHHEPDAVLINTGAGGPSGRPRTFPGVFGIPDSRGYPGFPTGPGTPRRPDVFGIPGDPSHVPRGPSVFGMPGDSPQMPRGPNVFDMPGGLPQMPGPGVFGLPGVSPQMPGTGVFGMPGGSPQIPVPGVFGIPDSLPQMPGRSPQMPGMFHISGGPPQILGQPGVFSVPGEVPQMPGRHGLFGPNTFEFPENPVTSRGPGYFGIPGQLGPKPSTGNRVSVRNDEQSGPVFPNGSNTFGIPGQEEPAVFGVPGVFFPERTFFSSSPASSGGNSPRKHNFGDLGGREIYDDPIADIFPIIDKSFLRSGNSK